MTLRLLVAAITLSCAVAHADNFTHQDAGAWSSASGLSQAALTYISGKAAKDQTFLKLFSQRAVTNAVVAQQLTASNISEIIRLVEKSWLPPTMGVGQYGGAEVNIVYDKGQVERLAGADSTKAVNTRAGSTSNVTVSQSAVEMAEKAKPIMTEETLRVRLIGSVDATKVELERLAKEGALVSRVDVKTVIRGPGLRAVSGVLTAFFFTNMTSNLYRAWDFSQKSYKAGPAAGNLVSQCKGTDSSDCKVPWYEAAWKTADYVFYTFHADQ